MNFAFNFYIFDDLMYTIKISKVTLSLSITLSRRKKEFFIMVKELNYCFIFNHQAMNKHIEIKIITITSKTESNYVRV